MSFSLSSSRGLVFTSGGVVDSGSGVAVDEALVVPLLLLVAAARCGSVSDGGDTLPETETETETETELEAETGPGTALSEGAEGSEAEDTAGDEADDDEGVEAA